MKISYAVTVKDEAHELYLLLRELNHHLDKVNYDFEIVILQDGEDENVNDVISEFPKPAFWQSRTFDGHFGRWKNRLNEMCGGDYILQLDADELPPPILMAGVGELVKANPYDLFYIPRINVVKGITDEDIKKWGWRRTYAGDLSIVNWPDWQGRLYKNIPTISWEGKVHERITGRSGLVVGFLPEDQRWAITHTKTIERQRLQNSYYERLT